VFARIDRRRKLPVTTLLYALGMDQEGIMDAFYNTVDYKPAAGRQGQGCGWVTRFFPERVRGTRPTYDLVNAATGEVITKAGDKVTPRLVKQLAEQGDINLLLPFEQDHRPLCRQGYRQRRHRLHLCRGRGRDHRRIRQGWRTVGRRAEGSAGQ
jgi:DNA-directed RNA polymerase beta subunit